LGVADFIDPRRRDADRNEGEKRSGVVTESQAQAIGRRSIDDVPHKAWRNARVVGAQDVKTEFSFRAVDVTARLEVVADHRA